MTLYKGSITTVVSVEYDGIEGDTETDIVSMQNDKLTTIISAAFAGELYEKVAVPGIVESTGEPFEYRKIDMYLDEAASTGCASTSFLEPVAQVFEVTYRVTRTQTATGTLTVAAATDEDAEQFVESEWDWNDSISEYEWESDDSEVIPEAWTPVAVSPDDADYDAR